MACLEWIHRNADTVDIYRLGDLENPDILKKYDLTKKITTQLAISMHELMAVLRSGVSVAAIGYNSNRCLHVITPIEWSGLSLSMCLDDATYNARDKVTEKMLYFDVKLALMKKLNKEENTLIRSMVREIMYDTTKNKDLKERLKEAGRRGGVSTHKGKAPFIAAYRIIRDRTPGKTRVIHVKKTKAELQPDCAYVTLMGWAKEADKEDDFNRRGGRPRNI